MQPPEFYRIWRAFFHVLEWRGDENLSPFSLRPNSSSPEPRASGSSIRHENALRRSQRLSLDESFDYSTVFDSDNTFSSISNITLSPNLTPEPGASGSSIPHENTPRRNQRLGSVAGSNAQTALSRGTKRKRSPHTDNNCVDVRTPNKHIGTKRKTRSRRESKKKPPVDVQTTNSKTHNDNNCVDVRTPNKHIGTKRKTRSRRESKKKPPVDVQTTNSKTHNDNKCVDVRTPKSKKTSYDSNKSNVHIGTKHIGTKQKKRLGRKSKKKRVDVQTTNSQKLNLPVYPEWHRDQWIKGNGVTGYKGVGEDYKTIKSKPWRCKYKLRQFRFALKGDAIEHFYRLTKYGI